jgi:hypothetical protein
MLYASVVDMDLRRDHEPPPVVAQHGWRYHHIGIPTAVERPGEIYLP